MNSFVSGFFVYLGMKRAINVVSLFDGMSCGQIALKESKIKINKYFASEIDKFAIQQTQHNFPNTIQLGDVTKVKAKDLPKIDLLIGGSPCQGFSFAGAGLNFEDPRSALFFEYVRILKELREVNPDIKFLLENVNMKREHLGVISKYLEIYPVRINSNLVSAQNRDRFYWTNIRTRTEGLFGELWSDIPQPKDRGILLKDILQPESEVDEKYYIKNPKIGFEGMDINGKNNTLRTSGQVTQSKKHNYDIIKLDKKLKPKPDQDKASTFTAGGHSGGNHSDMDIIDVSLTERRTEKAKANRRKTGTNDFRDKELVPREDGKVGALQTGLTKEQMILTKSYLQLDISGKGHKSQQDRFYYEDGKHGSLPAARASDKNGVMLVPEATKKGYAEINPGECVDLENIDSKTRRGRKMDDKSNCLMTGKTEFHKFTEDFKLRRLTPTECARLQTIPDWYKWVVSDTQIYRMLGNGWTVEVIKHILLS